jgi:putative aldouronate transport system substrate-binding protein
MFKKVLIFVGFITLFLTGCAAVVTPKPEPFVFSVLFNNKKDVPFQKEWRILEEYKNRQNVVLDVRLGDDAAYDKVLTQTLESGNIPDIVLKVYPKTVESYAYAGVLLPFSDYESLMPNFMAYIKKHNLQAEIDKLRLKNGKYYVLPGYQREIQVQQWIYRRDIFEKNNLAMPKTYNELFDDLVILKKLYPNTTPITASWNGAHLFAMMGAGYGIPAGWAGTSYYNQKENRWQFSPATDAYKELYRFLNRCYQAGILDPAALTQSNEDFTLKLGDGRALVVVTWITSGFSPWEAKLKENGFPDGVWAALPVPESTIGIRALPAVDPYRKGLIVPARVINEPYFKDLIHFLDWAVYSDEGMTLTTWGVEGFTYQNSANGKVFLPTIKTPKNAAGTLNISKEYGFDIMFNLNENEEFEDYKKPAEIVTFLEQSLNAKQTLPLSPQLVLDSNSVEAIRLINEKISPYVNESSIKFITGELSMDRDWNGYLLELQNRGYQTLESLWNDAWKKQKQ